MENTPQRERLGSRLGFLLLSAGCAIGLGNVWRFPFITGAYGGAAFVAIYIFFLLVFGLPILIMEFSVGRASQANIGRSFRLLEPEGTKWHVFGPLGLIGSYVLMMFYTVVAGWMLAYCWHTAVGNLSGLTPAEINGFFGNLLARPGMQLFWTAVVIGSSFWVCGTGVRNGVERVVKPMMAGLFLIILILVIRAVTLPDALPGIRFYLLPDVGKIVDVGLWNVINAAMAQAFFTLSIGIGSMAIFGSYIGKERSLTGESLCIVGLDTTIALLSGLIIFPACSAFGINADAGPGLIFVTLPNIFNNMPLGRLWGTLFFIFMSFAALSTVITVLENIISWCVDVRGTKRSTAAWVNAVLLFVLAVPCALGFNVLQDVTPLGAGSTILDLEDFIVSNNLLPLGSLVFLLFCCSKRGWGWNNFLHEVDQGHGLRFPAWARAYLTWVLPLLILIVLVQGYIQKFAG